MPCDPKLASPAEVRTSGFEPDQQGIVLGCDQTQNLKKYCGGADSPHDRPALRPDVMQKLFGQEKTNQLSPRSASKPPKAKRIVVTALEPAGDQAAAAGGQSPDSDLTPRRKLQKLGRFRMRDDYEVAMDLESPVSSGQ